MYGYRFGTGRLQWPARPGSENKTEEKEDGDTQWLQSACSQLASAFVHCARSPSPSSVFEQDGPTPLK